LAGSLKLQPPPDGLVRLAVIEDLVDLVWRVSALELPNRVIQKSTLPFGGLCGCEAKSLRLRLSESEATSAQQERHSQCGQDNYFLKPELRRTAPSHVLGRNGSARAACSRRL